MPFPYEFPFDFDVVVPLVDPLLATPADVGVAYDIVIENTGFIIEHRSYRIQPAPMLPPRVISAQETLQDVIGETRMAVWSDFRGGIDDKYTSKVNRYYRGQNIWTTKRGELGLAPGLTSSPTNSFAPRYPVKGAGGVVSINGNPLLLVNDIGSGDGCPLYYANDTTGWVQQTTLTNNNEMYLGGKILGDKLYLFGTSQFYYGTVSVSAPYNITLASNSGIYQYPTIYDDRLYLAGYDNTMSPKHKIFSMYPGTTSVIEIATLGKPDEAIRSMAVMAGTMYIGKTDGMWGFRQNRAWKVTSIEPSGTNIAATDPMANDMEEMTEHQGWLYYHAKGQQYRFNGSVIEPLYSGHLTGIGGFHTDGDLLYTRAVTDSVYGIWVMREGGIHNIFYGIAPPYNMAFHGSKTHLAQSNAGAAVYQYMNWVDRGKYIPSKYANSGSILLPWVDGGFPTWPKSYNDIQIKATFSTYSAANLSAGGEIDIYYQATDDTALLAKAVITKQGGEPELSDKAIIQNLRVRNKASTKLTLLPSTDKLLSPMVNMVSMSYTPRPPMQHQHGMRIRCEDNQELYNGSVQTYDGPQLQAILMNLASLDKVKLWGPMGGITSAYYKAGAIYSGDYASRLRKAGDGGTLDLSDADSGDLFIGSYFPYDLIWFEIVSSSSTLANQVVSQYVPDQGSWSLTGAAQLGTPQSVELLKDTTSDNGYSMSKSGYLAIQPTPMWIPTYGPASALLPLYWSRVKIHTSVILDAIRLGKWCQMKIENASSNDLTEEQVPIIAVRATEV